MPVHVHRIRLAGPWDVAGPFEEDDAADDVAWRRVDIPSTWQELFGGAAGTAHFRRSFNKPTNLTSSERVLVELPEEAGQLVAAEINKKTIALPLDPPPRLDVSNLLEDFNTLVLQIEFDPDVQFAACGGLWKPVVLAIESPIE